MNFTAVGKTKQPHFTDKKLPISPSYTIIEAVAGAEGAGYLALTGDVTALIVNDSYIIIRNSTGNDGFYQVKTSTFVSGETRIFPYGGVTDGTDDGVIYQPYYYSISAVDKEGNESAPSSAIIKTSPMDVIAPSTPTGFTARRLEDYSGVQLFWEENTESDLKGYVIYRTYDGLTYHIASILSANVYKDDDIPRSEDTFFDATYVAYAVAAYDKSGNIGMASSVLGFFTIPTIRGIRVSIDFLSLNVSWTEPLLEDGIGGVAVWYKKKVDALWIFAGSVDWPTSRLYIDGPLDRDTEYDVAIGTYTSSTYAIIGVHQGLKRFQISGLHDTEFPAGSILNISGSTGNDGQYTVSSAVNVIGPMTEIYVVESIPSGTVDGSLFCFTLQVPIKRVIIPDYDTDIVPPTDPWGLYGRADPQNDRIFLSWNRVSIDDDFLRFEILTLEGGSQYILHGTSRDNNYVLNDASYHVRPDGLIYIKVRAVDRSGNISGGSSFSVVYYSADLAVGVEFLPQWMVYTGDFFTSFQHASMRKYSLIVNDASEKALFFRRYVLFTASGAPVPPFINTIVGISQGSKTFSIAGNYTFFYPAGDTISVEFAAGANSALYTIVSSTFDATNTIITVAESIPDPTVQGYLYNFYNHSCGLFDLDGEEILAIMTSNQFTFSAFQDQDKAIILANAAAKVFRVSGVWTHLYTPGKKIVISGSTANDGTYTVDYSATIQDSSYTNIYVLESPVDNTADGQVDAFAIHIWPGVEDRFGAIYIGPIGSVLTILPT